MLPLVVTLGLLASTLEYATPTPSGRLRAARPLLDLRGGADSALDLLETERDLDFALEEAGSALVVVDFFAEWCGPCKKIAPVLEELARKTSSAKVRFYKVDVDQSRELAAARGVKSMPTLQFFRNGVQVKQIVGGDVAGIRAEVAKATMHPVLRKLKSEMLLVVVAAAYLVTPWDRFAFA